MIAENLRIFGWPARLSATASLVVTIGDEAHAVDIPLDLQMRFGTPRLEMDFAPVHDAVRKLMQERDLA